MDPERQCTATTRQGRRCRQAAILGGNVCRMHGGSAPQVRAKAEQRIAALVDPAIRKLSRLLDNPRTPPPVLLAAIKDILDRAGHTSVSRVEVTHHDGNATDLDAEIERLMEELAGGTQGPPPLETPSPPESGDPAG